ncbi:hypothetical protein KEM55_008552 [Ascosphaera atra]|nr:hypothetical protein KEM55_008552 [Ascosphaera atra]
MGTPNTAGRSGSHGGGPTTTTTTTTTYANNRQPPFAPVSSRPRRNSDTSIMERPSQRFERFEGEEDRRRREKERERRYREMSHREKDREHGYGYRERRGDREYDRDKERERERRHRYKEGERERGTRHREREGKDKDGKHQKSSKPNRKLDVIDKLDLTGVYGLGQFHHDGPFDACNPHRNRKGIRAAPMQAFAEDSPNMLPTGGGPKSFDHNLYHGRSHDPAMDFSRAAIKNVLATQNAQPKADVATYDPKGKIEPVHGAESMGLGTSTFLDGAPASKAAIQARNEDAPVPGAGSMGGAGAGAGGLQRKKSLAQKLRGVAGGNRVDRSARETTSPEPLDGEAGYGGALLKYKAIRTVFLSY